MGGGVPLPCGAMTGGCFYRNCRHYPSIQVGNTEELMITRREIVAEGLTALGVTVLPPGGQAFLIGIAGLVQSNCTIEEREIIAALERSRGRRLTQEEIDWSLKQARAIGDL